MVLAASAPPARPTNGAHAGDDEREKPSDQDLESMAKWQSEMEHLHGRAELIIGKQRHGPIGTIELSFEGQFTRFGNIAKAWQNELER